MALKRGNRSATTSKPKRIQRTRSIHSGRNILDSTPETSAFNASFLALPRELRDQIYHEIWCSKPSFQVAVPQSSSKGEHTSETGKCAFRGDCYVFCIAYKNAGRVISIPMPKIRSTLSTKKAARQPPSLWILTSKQILEEAMQQFNRQSTWTYMCASFGTEGRQLVAWRHPIARRANTRHNSTLLTLYDAHAISVTPMGHFLPIYVYGEMDSYEKPLSRVQFDCTHMTLLKAISSATNGSQNLKSLTFMLKVHSWNEDEEGDKHPIIVDFKVLESFNAPTLQTVKIIIYFNNAFRRNQRLMDTLKPSIDRLGGAMFGVHGDATGTFTSVTKPELKWEFVHTRR